MKKRSFLKNTALASVGLSTGSLVWQSCTPSTTQTDKSATSDPLTKNWAWIKPPSLWKMDHWKSKLALAKESGIDAIVLECYNSNATIYPHFNEDVPMRDNLLQDIIQICKSNDLEIHTWMWTVPCNIPQIILKHPDWYAVNGLGQPAHTHPAYVNYYKFLDPCHPEVQEFIAGNARSLAQVEGSDGVHLDYVRLPDVILAEALQPTYDIVQDKEYPEYDYNYSEHARTQFKEQTGIDPLKDLKDPAAHAEWRQFRYDSITNLVNNHLLPEIKKEGKMATAAVFPNWESVRQQWHNWELDAYLPMLYHGFYNRDIDFIEEHTKKALARLDGKAPVYSGLYMPDIQPEQMAAAHQHALSAGAKGISIFALENTTEPQWASLKETLKKKA
ncbi:MAG: family 10 glycosylhydrolase [Cytophagales bacterium]|nr:family 10 glycosylhydrolase [Cytophagales bacterium]